MTERRAMIQQTHELAVTRRCVLLDVPRSTAYYRPRTGDDADLALMRLIDEIHLQYPFYGSRRMRDELEDRGHTVNRKRIQRLMRQMDLRALYPRRRTSQPASRSGPSRRSAPSSVRLPNWPRATRRDATGRGRVQVRY